MKFVIFLVFIVVVLTISFSSATEDKKICIVKKGVTLTVGQETKDPAETCAGIKCGEDGQLIHNDCDDLLRYPLDCGLTYIDSSRDFPACCEKKVDCSSNPFFVPKPTEEI